MYVPSLDAVDAALQRTAPDTRRSIARELARLEGASKMIEGKRNFYIQCLDDMMQQRISSDDLTALRKISRRDAYRIFSFFPHPELPPRPRLNRETDAEADELWGDRILDAAPVPAPEAFSIDALIAWATNTAIADSQFKRLYFKPWLAAEKA